MNRRKVFMRKLLDSLGQQVSYIVRMILALVLYDICRNVLHASLGVSLVVTMAYLIENRRPSR